MAEQKRPNVTGKGPAFIREALAIFGEINGQCASLSPEAAEKIKSTLKNKGEEIEPIISRAYMKTVKAGETSYDCKVLAEALKSKVESCQETEALQDLEKLQKEMDGLIHKVKTFVVRMT